VGNATADPATPQGGGDGALQALSTEIVAAIEDVNVATYVIDRDGVIRWLNRAGMALVGDVRGQQFTSVVVPEDARRARELFARKILQTTRVTDDTVGLWDVDGNRLKCQVSSVPLVQGHRVVGVFGQLPRVEAQAPERDHPRLTPRQAEVLHLLEHGRSTDQIAEELQLSPETVRNHVRRLMRSLGVNSRLQAVAVARRQRA
jgi:PAS domain S-box-containing protein